MRLFRDRTLNIAILISTSWHLICMFSITPVLISGNIKENSTRVSFLGSILEKVGVVPEKSFSLDDKDTFIQRIEKLRDIGARGIRRVDRKHSRGFILAPPKISSKTLDVQLDKEGFIFSEDKHKSTAFKMYYKEKKRLGIKFKDVLVTGDAGNRIVLYKPDLPKISIFPSFFSSNYNVSIRFEVSRHGFVESPECIISSGSSEIDQIAIRYIRRWQFVPLDQVFGKVQEGIVRISF